MNIAELFSRITIKDIDNPTQETIDLLWEVWNLHRGGVRELADAKDEIKMALRLMTVGPWTMANPQHVNAVCALEGQYFRQSKLHLFYLASAALQESGRGNPPMFIGYVAMKQLSTLGSLSMAVKRAEEQREKAKELFIKKEHYECLVLYLRTLAELSPWSSDAIIMTFEQAGQVGLRQMLVVLAKRQVSVIDNSEQALLTNIGVVCKKIAETKDQDDRQPWVNIGVHAIWAVEHHPFLTWAGSIKRVNVERDLIKLAPDNFGPKVHFGLEAELKLKEKWAKKPSEVKEMK